MRPSFGAGPEKERLSRSARPVGRPAGRFGRGDAGLGSARMTSPRPTGPVDRYGGGSAGRCRSTGQGSDAGEGGQEAETTVSAPDNAFRRRPADSGRLGHTETAGGRRTPERSPVEGELRDGGRVNAPGSSARLSTGVRGKVVEIARQDPGTVKGGDLPERSTGWDPPAPCLSSEPPQKPRKLPPWHYRFSPSELLGIPCRTRAPCYENLHT